MIPVIDYGSQLTMNIARRIREHGVYSEVIPYTKADSVQRENIDGIVLSGGQFSVYDEGAPQVVKSLLRLGVPVLAICYGHQAVAHLAGGTVKPTDDREYGGATVRLVAESPLYAGINGPNIKVWMSHGDVVKIPPPGFKVTVRSENGDIAGTEGDNIYTTQFHPEADHTPEGRKILDNFIKITGAQRTWDPSKDFERIVEATQEQVRGKIGVGGVSGGVDSSAAAVLLKRLPTTSYPIFVDNGLLRLNEGPEVRASLAAAGLDIIYVDASDRFLTKLRDVADHDIRRKIIGHEFIDVFEEEARKIPGATYLFQGTLYPDVVESVPVFGSSSKIRRHHNVGGLPEKLGLELVEPWRFYFKDEVRRISERRLGLPSEIVWRQPFPGPGLAIRVEEPVTPENLAILRHADAIVREEVARAGLERDIGQAFAYLLGARVLGVKGDMGSKEYVAMVRGITSGDFMTADRYRFPEEAIDRITTRILNQVKGIGRVGEDKTPKPPGTIEPW